MGWGAHEIVSRQDQERAGTFCAQVCARRAQKIVSRQDYESVGSAHIFAQGWVGELMEAHPGKIRKLQVLHTDLRVGELMTWSLDKIRKVHVLRTLLPRVGWGADEIVQDQERARSAQGSS